MQNAMWVEKDTVSAAERSPEPADQEALVRLSGDAVEALQAIAAQAGLPLLPSLLGCWAILVGRWTMHDDDVSLRVRFSAPHGADRDVEAIALAIGRETLESTLNYRQFAAHLESLLAQAAPALLAEAVGAIVIENDDTAAELSLSLDAQNTLSAAVRRIGGEPGSADRMAQSWQVLLDRIASEPESAVRDLPILTAEERERVLYSFNASTVEFPRNKLMHELFEARVLCNPHSRAVVFNDAEITYDRLNRRANQLARYLVEHGVQPKQIIAVCMDRGIDVVAALLAVLKAGAAYLPLDPGYPEERLAHMLSDACPAALLTDRSTQRRCDHDGIAPGRNIVVEDALQASADYDASNLPRPFQSSTELAYVIYTSGSTGQPKGAMNEHRGMVNRIASQLHVEAMTTGDVCCQTTSISFVDAVLEIFGPLCNGQLLVVVPDQVVRDISKLAMLITERGITRLVTVPSLARTMLSNRAAMAKLSQLVSWTLSGEEVQPDLVIKLQQRLPGCEIIVQYGSSEVSSDAAIYQSRAFSGTRVPIGWPLQNVRIYVLDSRGEPVPTGVPGEICVAGVGVGRGYLNHPELTAPRFSTDPFSNDPTQRLYRMGDMGRWRADGTLEYLGRKDHQVKIRGFRVELGEIERRLLDHALVREAVVIAREDVPGEKRLVAYVALRTAQDEARPAAVVETTPSEPPLAVLRSHLKAALPDYMVPAAIVTLAQLPKTPNGKQDRRALPAPGLDAFTASEYQAPSGELEQSVALIWQELLHVARVGRNDSFFELGGHSLAVVELLDRLRLVGLTVDARAIYDKPLLWEFSAALTRQSQLSSAAFEASIPQGCAQISPEMLPLVRLSAEHIERIESAVPGGARNIQDIFPLAPNQQGILFHCSVGEARADTYVLATAWSFDSRQRLDRFIQCVQSLIERHDVLRTSIHWEQLTEAVQVVQRQASLSVEQLALGAGAERAIDRMVQQWRDDQPPIDLRAAPLVRLLVSAEPDERAFHALLIFHHIVIDDVSLNLLAAELVADLNGTAAPASDALPYRAHVARLLNSDRTDEDAQFFKEKLGDVQESTAPFGVLGIRGSGAMLVEAHHEMAAALEQQARLQARRLGVSMATLFHAAWSLVVAHTSGRGDVVFGTVLLGRLQGGDMRRSLGMFVNTLPLRLRLDDLTARELVERTQREVVALLGHESASLVSAQRSSGVPASNPLFTALLNYRQGAAAEGNEPRASGVDMFVCQNRTHYPIAVSIDDSAAGIGITAQTDRRIAATRLIGYLVEAMRSLVKALEHDAAVPALDLNILPAHEQEQLLRTFNATSLPYDSRTPVYELIDQQRRRTPDAVAIRQGSQSLTYAQLAELAERWARVLQAAGLGRTRNERIGVYLERSIEMVASQLAIWKLGAAFVPVDPAQPAERIAHVLRDCAPTAVIADRRLAGVDAIDGLRIFFVDQLGSNEALLAQPIDVSAQALDSAEHLAYVIYTSGSTGAPKGVMVSHRGLLNLITWHRTTFGIEPGWLCSSLAAVGFDATVWEIWPALCAGATVVLAPTHVRGDVGALLSWWSSEPLDVSFLPTPMAEVVFRDNIQHETLRALLVGGDTLRQVANAPSYRLFNNYGPTECTVVATSGRIDPSCEKFHIGRPIANSQAYILDRQRRPVPIDVIGELYMGGDGIAMGYLDRPELTAERFLNDPFVGDPTARLYRTGDLARWRADGTIEYVGRNDQQIKIRGNRVELGEIEAHLLSFAAVQEAAVLAREDVSGEKIVVAYVVARHPSEFSAADLRDKMKQALPAYMVPATFVVLDNLPLSANGKLDRAALAKQTVSAVAERACVAATTDTQRVLCDLWSQVLPVKVLGVEDNFFEVGGHSINAMTLVARISEHFDIDLAVTALFRNPTVRQLEVFLQGRQAANQASAALAGFQEGIL